MKRRDLHGSYRIAATKCCHNAKMTSQRIAKEYSQWLFALRLLERLTQATEGNIPAPHRNASSVKLANAFGRWLASLQLYACQNEESSEYPLFPKRTVCQENSKNELIRLLKERFQDMDQVQAANLADEICSLVIVFHDSDYNQQDSSFVLKYERNGSSGCISVGEFCSESSLRIPFLVDRFGLMKTALACMRYDSLSQFKGGESGLSVVAFKALHDLGGATHEGFASPINCRLLGRPDIKFCSLFADTDSAFGSLGNFFLINLNEHPGGWILNPPFIESMMGATARKVVDHLREAEQGSIWFYIAFPMWQDCDAWKDLDQSEWKVARIDLHNHSFINQDCYGGLLWPDCDICVFVLGQPPENVDLIKLGNQISCTSEERVKAEWALCCT